MSRNRSYTPNPVKPIPHPSRRRTFGDWLSLLRPARRSQSPYYHDNRPNSYSGYPALNGYQDNRGRSRSPPRPQSVGGAPQYPPPPLHQDPRDIGYASQPPVQFRDGSFGPAPYSQVYYPPPPLGNTHPPSPPQQTGYGTLPNNPPMMHYGDGSYGPAIPPPGPPPNWQGQNPRYSNSRSQPGNRPASRNSGYDISPNRGSPAPPPGTGSGPPPPGPSSTWNGLNRPGYPPHGSEDDFVMPSGPNGQHRNGHKTHYMSGGAEGWPDQPVQPVAGDDRGRTGFPDSRSSSWSDHGARRSGRQHRSDAKEHNVKRHTQQHERNEIPGGRYSDNGTTSGSLTDGLDEKYRRFHKELMEEQKDIPRYGTRSAMSGLPSKRIKRHEFSSYARYKQNYFDTLAKEQRKGRKRANREDYGQPSQESSGSYESSRSESDQQHRHHRHRDKEHRHRDRDEDGDHRSHHKREHRRADKHRHGRHHGHDGRDRRNGNHHRNEKGDRDHHHRGETPSDIAPKPKKRHHRQRREDEYYNHEEPQTSHHRHNGRTGERLRKRDKRQASSSVSSYVSRRGDFAKRRGTGGGFFRFAVGIIPVTMEAGAYYVGELGKFVSNGIRSV